MVGVCHCNVTHKLFAVKQTVEKNDFEENKSTGLVMLTFQSVIGKNKFLG